MGLPEVVLGRVPIGKHSRHIQHSEGHFKSIEDYYLPLGRVVCVLVKGSSYPLCVWIYGWYTFE